MADFSSGLTEGSFLLLNGQKHMRSVAEDFISNNQKELNKFIKKGEGTDIIKHSKANISQHYFPGCLISTRRVKVNVT